MSDRRFKYTLNGVYKCENVAQSLQDNYFPQFHIGPALGLGRWVLGLQKVIENGKLYIYPAIYNNLQPRKMRVRAYFNVLKKDGSSLFKTEFVSLCLESDEICGGPDMEVEKLLDEKNEYLDNGALSFELGFQVECEEGEDGIWLFNFCDPFFDSEDKDIIFEFEFQGENSLFGHRQIVELHSKELPHSCDGVQVPDSFSREDVNCLLQIAHGVRLQLTAIDYEETIISAFPFGFFNAVRYCECQLIEMDEQPEFKMGNFKLAVEYDMRRYLNHLLKEIKSTKQLIEILIKLDLEDMSSESMKTFVGKYLDLDD